MRRGLKDKDAQLLIDLAVVVITVYILVKFLLDTCY